MKKRFLSEEDFIDFLSTQGLSLTEFRDYLKDQMLNEILINAEIKSRIIISPSEVTKYYESHAADFYFPERARVESIFVNNENTAREVYRKLQSGADFAELRKGYSKRTDLGVVAKGQLRKEIEDVIFNLGVGKFSRPFETSEGYYIFLVKEKIPPSQRALIEVQPTVYDKIWQDKFNAKFKGFMQELKDKAFVQIKYEQ
jgi:parvulin-like peptidyl-prolyl isomerase